MGNKSKLRKMKFLMLSDWRFIFHRVGGRRKRQPEPEPRAGMSSARGSCFKGTTCQIELICNSLSSICSMQTALSCSGTLA
eukprot:g10220.t1